MTKKFLITSALPYVNAVPHLGNLIGSTLSADVFARYCRLLGRETLYICGSDEHGTATETKAREEGVTPKELCDKYYAIHKEIYDWFNISFDIFGRTSDKSHHKITQELFEKVLANGYIEEKTIVQPFSVSEQTFLADRFVEGTCPHCNYENARGDQCDNCGKLLDPKDLINPRSASDGSTPEFRETKHLFFALDKLQPVIEKWFTEQSVKGGWSQTANSITKSWLKEGLQGRAITRDLKWGIQVPQSAFEGRYSDKVFYVWFDAPIGYISLTAQLTDDWKSWWQDPENTLLYQFIGKDNVPFHSIIFPATEIAAAENNDETYTTVHHLNATEYLNYEHSKFSKSRGVGVFGDTARESGIPADVFRYVLLYHRPEGSDTQFTWKDVQERVNNELVANFGNLVNRTLTFVHRFFDGKVPDLDVSDPELKTFLDEYRAATTEYLNLLDKVKLRDALHQFMKLSALGNKFFQDAAPWKTRTEDPERAKRDLAVLVNIVTSLSFLIEPYLPSTAKEIRRQLGIPNLQFEELDDCKLSSLSIGEPTVLFKKIEDKEVEELRAKYGGATDKKEKQEKKETKKDSKQPSKEVTPIQTSDVDFVVGKITEIKKHEKADKLYVEQVDVGNGVTKQIVSGLVDYYSAEDMLGKHIIVINNLKPAKLRGEKSEGMVLAAETAEGIVGLVLAPESEPGTTFNNSAPKDAISFEEFHTLDLKAVGGKVVINGQEAALSDGKGLIIDKDIKDGNLS